MHSETLISNCSTTRQQQHTAHSQFFISITMAEKIV